MLKNHITRLIQRIKSAFRPKVRRFNIPDRSHANQMADTPVPDQVDAAPRSKPVLVAANKGSGAIVGAMPYKLRRIVSRAFDSSRPVRSRSELFGRQREIDSLMSAVLDCEQHAIVYGARGSGKSSLSQVFGDFADQNGAIVIYFSCEPGSSFSELLTAYIEDLPELAIAPAMRNIFYRRKAQLRGDFGPRAFVELVSETLVRPTIFVFDEFDRITNPKTTSDMAFTMKMLSDAHSNLSFMLVGIARSVSDVIDNHPSLRRHLHTVKLKRIESGSVEALIEAGMSQSGIPISEEAQKLIVLVACGSPYHVRMFCQKATFAAIAKGMPSVDIASVLDGFLQALDDWAGTSPENADLFAHMIEVPEILPGLVRVARSAAENDDIDPDTEDLDAIKHLLPVLEQATANDVRLTFKDSLAPQFLLATFALVDAGRLGKKVVKNDRSPINGRKQNVVGS